jgi:hypothetical protein
MPWKKIWSERLKQTTDLIRVASNRENTSMKAKTQILCCVVASLCAAGCKPKPVAIPPPPLVEIATVTQADVPIFHDWIGSLDGLVNAQIRAQVAGYLLKQGYREVRCAHCARAIG